MSVHHAASHPHAAWHRWPLRPRMRPAHRPHGAALTPAPAPGAEPQAPSLKPQAPSAPQAEELQADVVDGHARAPAALRRARGRRARAQPRRQLQAVLQAARPGRPANHLEAARAAACQPLQRVRVGRLRRGQGQGQAVEPEVGKGHLGDRRRSNLVSVQCSLGQCACSSRMQRPAVLAHVRGPQPAARHLARLGLQHTAWARGPDLRGPPQPPGALDGGRLRGRRLAAALRLHLVHELAHLCACAILSMAA